MHTPEEPARRALIRAGEKLFAAKAVGEVTEAEIVEQAGLSDETSVEDFFGNRLGLLRTIIDAHQIPADARRNRLLDDQLREGRPDGRSAVEVLVHPLADKLTDPHGGPEYLMICARLRRDPELFGMLLAGSPSISRALEFVVPDDALADDPTIFHRLEIVSSMIVHSLADFAQEDRDDHGPFVGALIDSICAVVAWPAPERSPKRSSPTAIAATRAATLSG